ncbi:hypothetical protein DEU37_0409 [Microbacterium sp. AG790]|uniref:DUF2076 family protein n=1 Tax=Microbacterium sp. AG790 TaxID=2183995 RepID=UPI000EB235EA|nr:DUF2076 family protein [Microbacterium sp. AG790]RKS93013.1 hypothetical protein DEU37_0409 [Microbacterium sp. AG790]
MQTSDVRLIVDLADAVRGAAPLQKDEEAARLIDQLIGSQADALYFLVQTVLLQKEALAASGAAPASGGPVPDAPPAAAGPAPADAGRGRWGGLFGSRRESGEPQPAAAGGGGSFLRTAAAGAAGVAGGVLLAQGISGLFTPPPAPPVDSADGGLDAGDDGGWDLGDVF